MEPTFAAVLAETFRKTKNKKKTKQANFKL
jgi:hypothetical protein